MKRLQLALTFVSRDENGNLRSGSGTKSLKEALINAFIMGGLSFFTTLAGMSIAQVVEDPVRALSAAGIAAGLAFFTRLAIERGLMSSKKK